MNRLVDLRDRLEAWMIRRIVEFVTFVITEGRVR